MKITVAGESCVDAFSWCRTLRMAPDKPVPVVEITNRQESPGMASNTDRNLMALGAQTSLVTNPNWREIRKERLIDEATNHMFIRIDSPIHPEPLELREADFAGKVVVLSDYDKGFLTEDAIRDICELADLVFLDSKKVLGSWASGADIIKINAVEYSKSRAFVDSHLWSKTIWTDGGGGANYMGVNFPTAKMDVIDVSGAGDTFMAGLVVGYLDSENVEKAISFANEVSREVVGQRGVTVPTGRGG